MSKLESGEGYQIQLTLRLAIKIWGFPLLELQELGIVKVFILRRQIYLSFLEKLSHFGEYLEPELPTWLPNNLSELLKEIPISAQFKGFFRLCWPSLITFILRLVNIALHEFFHVYGQEVIHDL